MSPIEEPSKSKLPKPPKPPPKAAERPGAAVVLLALLRVAEHVVGLGDLLEARLGLLVVRVAVGVVLARELAVGLLDLLGGRLFVDPERLVVVGRVAIAAPPSTRRRARAPGAARSRPAGSRAGRPRRRSRSAPSTGCWATASCSDGSNVLADGREGLDPGARERRAQLRACARGARPRAAGRPGRGLERAVEVVERRQQLLGELRHAALLRGGGVARDALAVVLEVGLRALREREVLVALLRPSSQLVEVALDLAPRRRRASAPLERSPRASPPRRSRAGSAPAPRSGGLARRSASRAAPPPIVLGVGHRDHGLACGSSTTSASTTSSSLGGAPSPSAERRCRRPRGLPAPGRAGTSPRRPWKAVCSASVLALIAAGPRTRATRGPP
jgi:hypothetical protein